MRQGGGESGKPRPALGGKTAVQSGGLNRPFTEGKNVGQPFKSSVKKGVMEAKTFISTRKRVLIQTPSAMTDTSANHTSTMIQVPGLTRVGRGREQSSVFSKAHPKNVAVPMIRKYCGTYRLGASSYKSMEAKWHMGFKIQTFRQKIREIEILCSYEEMCGIPQQGSMSYSNSLVTTRLHYYLS